MARPCICPLSKALLKHENINFLPNDANPFNVHVPKLCPIEDLGYPETEGVREGLGCQFRAPTETEDQEMITRDGLGACPEYDGKGERQS